MIWNKNLVIVLATLGAFNACFCNAAEQKEHQESAAPIAYTADGRLCMAVGNQIIKAGTQPQTLHTADSLITALACSPTDVDTFAYALPQDSEPDQIIIKKEGKPQSELKYEEDQKSSYGQAKGQFGKTISLRFSPGGETILRTSHNPVQTEETYGLRSHSINKEGNWNPYFLEDRFDCVGFSSGKNGAYLITPEDHLKEQYCLFIDQGVLLIQKNTPQDKQKAPSERLLKQREENATFKNIAYSPGYLVLAKIMPYRINYLYLSITPRKWNKPNGFFLVHECTIRTDPYELIELSKVKPGKRPTLIATKPDGGADLYFIKRSKLVNRDVLVKITSIETDGEVQHIDSTPGQGWFSPAKTALSTPQTIHEIDSRSGEEIARYDKASAKQTYWNWRRTARRAAYATAATLTSVAAAVLSYKWFSNSSNK